jgi:CRISPR-associated endonuclease/helicase Cas3
MGADGTLIAPAAKCGAGEGGRHPLVCHALDVLSTAELLWAGILPERTRDWVAADLGLPVPVAGAWVSALAGLHDLGKLSPSFQFGVLQSATALHSDLEREGLTCAGSPPHALHGELTAAVLRDDLRTRWGVGRMVAQGLAQVVGGHHGLFPGAEVLGILGPAARGDGPWDDARMALVDAVFGAAGVVRGGPAPSRCTPRVAMLVGGLVSVADWIGSNTEFFPYALPADPADGAQALDVATYAATARRQASAALDGLGWRASPRATAPTSFEAMFGFPPRPLQAATAALAAELDSPGIVVVEAPMGEGKTEAALYLADAWGTTLGARGAYVALPTQATSNQMFGRVRSALDRRYHDQRVVLQLLHGHAALNAEFETLLHAGDRLFAPVGIAGDEAAGDGTVVAGTWFTSRKRGLLAPYGVGTIDQALLAALVVRHVFVRLFGLAGRVVVIDEVHAYDTYMSTLLERLVEWLGALGSPVVLLSATLPWARRDSLVAAYARGAGFTIPSVSPAPYPRIAWASPAAIGTQTVAAAETTRRRVVLDWVHPGDDGRISDATLDSLADDILRRGCVALVCNTVERAQDVFRRLRARVPGVADDGEPIVDLLHARFPYSERAIREARVLRRFGRGAGTRRPDRAAIVATQVIEQSLDLDFDAMLSDFAPVDLLLQRSGRLHRHHEHDAGRPPHFATAALRTVAPCGFDAGAPRFDPGTTAVYEDGHVRLRTWLALRGLDQVTIPDDLDRLVQAVYADADPPSGTVDDVAGAWRATRHAADVRRESDEREAQDRWVCRPGDAGATVAELTRNATGDDPDAGTFRAMTRFDADSELVIWLDAGGIVDGVPSDLETQPTVAEARRLLGRSLRLGGRDVTRALLELPEPRGWRRSALLRGARALVADDAGVCRLTDRGGTIDLRLDPDLGLIIERRAAGGTP